jgi:hypothetical protein
MRMTATKNIMMAAILPVRREMASESEWRWGYERLTPVLAPEPARGVDLTVILERGTLVGSEPVVRGELGRLDVECERNSHGRKV